MASEKLVSSERDAAKRPLSDWWLLLIVLVHHAIVMRSFLLLRETGGSSLAVGFLLHTWPGLWLGHLGILAFWTTQSGRSRVVTYLTSFMLMAIGCLSFVL